MSFNNLKLIEPVLRALKQEGYTNPTPIQQQAIPAVLAGRDVKACAQTGTGKTAAFAIPLLQLMHQRQKEGPQNQKKKIQALVLTPTRELAIQIEESFKAYGRFLHLYHLVVFGGVSQVGQVKKLRKGVDILVATPGRLLDLMHQGHVSFKDLRYLVLDEADRMLDMGFVKDVKRIIAKLPEKKQTLFFSATMPFEINALSRVLLNDPVSVEVTPVSSTVEAIQQHVYFTQKPNKNFLLKHILADESIETALVFTRTKYGADKLVRFLNKNNIRAKAIHGNKSQGARQAALKSFKNRNTRVLVATDIAARGIDIDELTHVFNYELPEIPETYVHRIGRTGRAGASGHAISFCDYVEKPLLKEIQKLIKKTIPVNNDHPYALSLELQDMEAKPAKKSLHMGKGGRGRSAIFRPARARRR